MDGAILLFDGVCNFCNSSVNFIIKRDKKKYFHFAPIQSAAGERLINQYHLHHLNLQTLILIEKGKVYTHSSGALRVARKLSGRWFLFYPLILLPRFIRDIPYKLIGQNRYRWFGKREECMIPTSEIKKRFVTD
jgi:predicted DCC family thiol-disulfide oxidoreductase YuxK